GSHGKGGQSRGETQSRWPRAPLDGPLPGRAPSLIWAPWSCLPALQVWGFYRGLSLPVCTVSLVSSVSFGTYRHCLAHICRFRYGSTDIKPAKTDITLSGFASGLVRVFLTSPTEVAKVRLQTQTQQRRPSASWPSAVPPACPAPPASSGPGPKYRGPLHCLATVAREEGLRGLYKGSSALLFRDGHSFATYFLSYTILCEQLTPTGRSQPGEGGPGPGRWQLRPGEEAWTRSCQTGRHGASQGGGRGALQPESRARPAAWLRAGHGGGGSPGMRYVGAPARGGPAGPPPRRRPVGGRGTGGSLPADVLGVLVAGGCAGVLAWAVATPMDVIKSRLQADGQGRRRYRGLLHCVVSSVREEGPRVLFKGLTLNCCRAFPVNMVVFVTYEAVLGLTRGLST
uniref:Solute carrier family 25 member 47 n=1 Tax=Lynx canadensis TaxID=61383 RepID=A0A667FHA6_LYNCA